MNKYGQDQVKVNHHSTMEKGGGGGNESTDPNPVEGFSGICAEGGGNESTDPNPVEVFSGICAEGGGGNESTDPNPVEVFCGICADSKDTAEMFGTIRGCSHSFCGDCISRHVTTKVCDNVAVVKCPGLECVGVLEIEDCKGIVPEDLAIRWERARCEAVFLESQKFYCPFKDCSAMLIKDWDDGEKDGGDKIRECECPHCHRLFCAECEVSWHAGVTCGEYQALGEDERGSEDLMVRELASANKWRRCPSCKYYVERTQGCPHIICRWTELVRLLRPYGCFRKS